MTATTLTTFEEFERLDFGADDVQLLKGVVIRMPPPADEHMEICERLFEHVKEAVERVREANPSLNLGRVHMERGYKLNTDPPSWLRPDVSITHPNQPKAKFLVGAPLMVFNIVSPSQSASDLEEEVSEYLANGAAEVWLFYPKNRHAWVYEPSGAARLEAEAVRSSLLPDIETPFSAIL